MLIQDMLTGYVHEVPDQSYGENLAGYGFPYGSAWRQTPQNFGQVVYDGFGNPVGLPFIAALAPLAAKAVGAIAPLVAKAAPMIAAKAAPIIAKVGPNIANVLPMVSAAAPMLQRGAVPLPLGPSMMMRSAPRQTPFSPAAPMAFDPARPHSVSPMPHSAIPAMPAAPGARTYPVAFRRRRRRTRRVAIRRMAPSVTAFAPPSPPVIEASVRTEPGNTVSGYGYYGGFRGYGWR